MSFKLYKCFKYEKNSSKIEASDDVILDLLFFFLLRFGSWKSVVSFHRALKKKNTTHGNETRTLIITATV